MSYDESDEDGEWEVVDLYHTSKSVKPNKKPKPVKQEDVDRLAKDIQSQLSLKSSHDTQQILLLEQKMRQQQKMSEQQLATIQQKLQQITQLQSHQEQQQRDLDAQHKQQLLEQQIQIQSLSDHQMLTQKQLAEAHQKIQQTQQVAQCVTENVQSLHQRQQLQATHQQMTEQQIQQQLQEQQQQLHTQQQLAQLAAVQQNAQAHQLQQHSHAINVLAQPQVQVQPQVQPQVNGHSNGWLPSFFAFGNNKPNTSAQDMDLAPSPPLRPGVAEEKANILMDDDDEDVLAWKNDYGTQQVQVQVTVTTQAMNPL